MSKISNEDIAGLMALRDYAYDIDQAGPSYGQGDTFHGRKCTKPKAKNKPNAVDAECSLEIVEKKQELEATNNTLFEFDDLFNLTGSPDQMCDADLAPKNLQTHNNIEQANASSSLEIAYATNALQSNKQLQTPQSVATDGSGEIKQSPLDYNIEMKNTEEDHRFYEGFATYAVGPHVAPLQPCVDQEDNMNPGKTQDFQATTLHQPAVDYSISDAYSASPRPVQALGNSSIPGPELMTWNTQDTPSHNDGAVEVKDERYSYKDPSDLVILQFSSSKEANDYRPDRRPMPFDATIPRNAYERQECVIKLIKAMRSFECATDNWGMIKPFATKKFSGRKIEICCWNILDCCIVRQEAGPFLTPEEEALKNKTRKNKQNFAERFGDMLRILRTRKTVCRHLLDPYYLLQFVDDPNSCLSRVDSNKTLNAKKKQTIDAGKKVIAKRAAEDDVAAEDEAQRPLASPFSTPKQEVSVSSSSSNLGYLNPPVALSAQQHLGSAHADFHQLSPQVSPIMGMQPQLIQHSASGAQLPYHVHPVGSLDARSSTGFHQGQTYTPRSGAATNASRSNMGTMASPIYPNILSPPRSPWNQTYSNAIPSSQYPPRTPNMLSATPHFASTSVSSEVTPGPQPKPARKASRKRSADIPNHLESSAKKAHH
ncbi:hypothetical protein MGYG_00012 [Nannizzia gypsea CBS 118893]|uniref:Uncharacterized protein n=1 Tax=Arthroderma gypseum (strain ATCC MYA-4604 / CBS 118893) TaxID=535722 RepID=E5R1X5_ARTGP|nr:hypothetical protein MGYG_00012 [Nannizzia gypsea CBS 118893]EFQ96968.1 hypothetical protein MGYG_00012 [Nannizzia gypsea CBS 118893]